MWLDFPFRNFVWCLFHTKGLIMYKWMWFVDQKWIVGNLDFLVPIHFHYHIQFTLSYNSLVDDKILCNCTRQDILKFMLWVWNVKSYQKASSYKNWACKTEYLRRCWNFSTILLVPFSFIILLTWYWNGESTRN